MSVGNTVLRENGEHADPTNCGAGSDDPGCAMNRNGSKPLDQREFTATLDNLRRHREENQRHNELGPLFNNRVMTARQLGALIDLFPNEAVKLEVAKERARSVLDPEHLRVFGAHFHNPSYRQQYEATVQNAEHEAHGGGTGTMQTLRGATTIRR